MWYCSILNTFICSCICDHLSFSTVIFPRDTSNASSSVWSCRLVRHRPLSRLVMPKLQVLFCKLSIQTGLWCPVLFPCGRESGAEALCSPHLSQQPFPLLDVSSLFMQLHRMKKAARLPAGRWGSGKGPVLGQQRPVTWKGALTQRTVMCHPSWTCPQPARHSLWVLPSLGIFYTHTFLICWIGGIHRLVGLRQG